MLSVRPLNSDLQIKAKKELKEVHSRVQEDIQYIRSWLIQQPHLKACTDDQWILSFLRGCKFSLQKTKQKLDMFYTIRSLSPELYTNRDPRLPEIQEVLKLGLCLPLLKTDGPGGPRVVIVRCAPLDTTKITFLSVMKVTLMIIDILMNEDDNFIVAGQHGLADFTGMSMNHIFHLDLSVCKKAAICLQQGYPTRPKGFHCINYASGYFETIYKIVKPFLAEKIMKRVTLYDSCNSTKFQKAISPTILPKEYGGSGASIKEITRHWKDKVESYRDWFLEEAKYGSDESKRIGKHKTSSDLFGVEGSFRKLDVD